MNFKRDNGETSVVTYSFHGVGGGSHYPLGLSPVLLPRMGAVIKSRLWERLADDCACAQRTRSREGH